MREEAWITSATGRRIYPLDPRRGSVDIVDVAHALAHLCRFNGHCAQFYSVAEHSVMVADMVKDVAPELELHALIHDAPEAYLGDLPRPVKHSLPAMHTAEILWEKEIHRHLGLRWPLDPAEQAIIKASDRLALCVEMHTMKVGEYRVYDYLDGRTKEEWLKANTGRPYGWSPGEAKAKFLERFKALLLKD